jgi:hypothetical protein
MRVAATRLGISEANIDGGIHESDQSHLRAVLNGSLQKPVLKLVPDFSIHVPVSHQRLKLSVQEHGLSLQTVEAHFILRRQWAEGFLKDAQHVEA